MEDIILTQDSETLQRIMDAAQRLTSDDKGDIGFGYGICETPGYIQEKRVDIVPLDLMPGSIFSVFFPEGFSVSNPTLNVNGTGPRALLLFGSAIAPGKVRAGTILVINFDGTSYNVIKITSNTISAVAGAVDLALPSGLLWCEHNVGAATPEQRGWYFSWGNVTGQDPDDEPWFSEDGYAASAGAQIDGDINVSDEYDMVHHNMGGQWRLPRPSEFQELIDNCDIEGIEQDGVAGVRFTSRINGNSLFFPAGGRFDYSQCGGLGHFGYYWSSHASGSVFASCMSITDETTARAEVDSQDRYKGLTVRGVM